MVKLEINGVAIEAEAGSMIIQIADNYKIPIPRFCYHPKLSIAANCRMCLVQVDEMIKPVPACATPVTDGMKIWTDSKIAIEAQKSVMEFLLINHPLDCPICDQGGECELQDYSIRYGADKSEYLDEKRTVADKNLGPLITTNMNRCIHCTRCVRFGQEIAGQQEMGVTGRGELAKIGTFIEQNIHSELSGNMIDLCPVGALTSKPFKFKARSWELRQYPAIAMHDCVGSNIYYHVRDNKVLRVIARENNNLNEIWLSDRDRFSYEAMYHDDRLRTPLLLKPEGNLIVSWFESLKYAAAGLKLVLESFGPEQIGFLAGPNATVEEYYILQQLARALGSNNIDYRLRTLDFSEQDSEPLYPSLGVNFEDIESRDRILLIGSHIHKEQPIAGIKIRKMTLRDGKVSVINPVDFSFNFEVCAKSIVPANQLINTLAGLAKELLIATKNNEYAVMLQNLKNINVSHDCKKIAAQLLSGKKVSVILGQLVIMHPEAAAIKNLARLIAKLSNASFGVFTDGANAAGACLAGCTPHRLPGGKSIDKPGKHAGQMLSKPQKAYILLAFEPEFDSILGKQAVQTLKEADFVVVLTAFQNPALFEYADLVLPISLHAENSGTVVNFNGYWQTYTAAVLPFAESRPAWKILRTLANLLELPGFEYQSSAEILETVRRSTLVQSEVEQPIHLKELIDDTKTDVILCISPVTLYASDYLVRRSMALQQTYDAYSKPILQLNTLTAKKLGFKHGQELNIKNKTDTLKFCLEINERVADNTAICYSGNANTYYFGSQYQALEFVR